MSRLSNYLKSLLYSKPRLHPITLFFCILLCRFSTYAEDLPENLFDQLSDNKIAAENIPGPQVCVGYNHETKEWGSKVLASYDCPQNHAVFALDDPGGPSKGPEFIVAQGFCCPLPANDILLDQELSAASVCPDNFIATGLRLNLSCPECKVPLRCTKINSIRYQLKNETPGIYWGVGATFWFEKSRLSKRDIPAAIRYGIGRFGKTIWDEDGCIGVPFGSLLVRKTNKRCNGFYFRQLVYRGLPGDPPQGTIVKMFPDCEDITDVFDPNAKCVE